MSKRIDPVIFYWCMLYIKGVLIVLDFVLDKTIGYSIFDGWRSERAEADTNFEKCAHVVEVIERGGYSNFGFHFIENFLYRHKAYVHPRIVLERDDATIHGFTPTHVYFCICDIDVYDLKVSGFAHVLQYEAAKQLVLIKHEDFIRLMSEIDQSPWDSRQLVFIQGSSRCGSTLLSQMLSQVPDTRVQSESWPLVILQLGLRVGMLDPDLYPRLIKATVLAQAKPEHSRPNDKRVVIKFVMFQLPNHKMMCEMFPRAKTIFCSRLPKPSIVSLSKLVKSLPYSAQFMLPMVWYLALPVPYTKKYEKIRLELESRKWNHSTIKMASHCFAATYASFLDAKATFGQRILYEDLTTTPQEVMTDILTYLDIPSDYLKQTLVAMNWDSQHGLFGNTSGMDKSFGSRKKWLQTERIFKKFDVPLTLDMNLEELRKLVCNDDPVPKRHTCMQCVEQ